MYTYLDLLHAELQYTATKGMKYVVFRQYQSWMNRRNGRISHSVFITQSTIVRLMYLDLATDPCMVLLPIWRYMRPMEERRGCVWIYKMYM